MISECRLSGFGAVIGSGSEMSMPPTRWTLDALLQVLKAMHRSESAMSPQMNPNAETQSKPAVELHRLRQRS
jgi:hypothetical protein